MAGTQRENPAVKWKEEQEKIYEKASLAKYMVGFGPMNPDRRHAESTGAGMSRAELEELIGEVVDTKLAAAVWDGGEILASGEVAVNGGIV